MISNGFFESPNISLLMQRFIFLPIIIPYFSSQRNGFSVVQVAYCIMVILRKGMTVNFSHFILYMVANGCTHVSVNIFIWRSYFRVTSEHL